MPAGASSKLVRLVTLCDPSSPGITNGNDCETQTDELESSTKKAKAERSVKTELKIIKIEDKAIDGFDLERLRLPTGQIGEIIVAGDHVLRDYFRNEEAVRLNKIKKGNEELKKVDNEAAKEKMAKKLEKTKELKEKIVDRIDKKMDDLDKTK